MEKSILTEEIKEKWAPVLDAEGVTPITDRTVRNNTIRVLENTVNEANMTTGATPAGIGGISTVSDNQGTGAGFDPVLISMVRRAMPVLVANDIMGVQPMSGPTGLIFAMNSQRVTAAGVEQARHTSSGFVQNALNSGAGTSHTTAAGEILGSDSHVDATSASTTEPVAQTNPWLEASFDISKSSVTAKTKAMKASYTMELAQDLKAVHGLDAESELASLLTEEIVTEINREMVNLVNDKAIVGAQQTGVATAGTFDVAADTDARWQIEAYKGLYFQIEREANLIGKMTGRGRGNIIICSADVASALEASQNLVVAPVPGQVLGGWTGISFAGVLNGRYKVFIDPYATTDYVTVGYKGSSVYDAGLYYCPYVPLQMMKATGEDDFSPRIGFKTRYGLVANPFAGGVAFGAETGTNGNNQYYRRMLVTNISVTH